jgi:hypothetical protein
MSYLLIESRDPLESTRVQRTYDLAVQLRAAGSDVVLYLVQNGVTPARAGGRRSGLENVIAARIEVLADEFSLRERGLPPSALLSGIRAAPIDAVIERMAAGWKAIWN